MRAVSSLRWLGSAVCVGLVLGMAGCRPGTALHSRYNDFRAYYNAYYNAEQKLEEGEDALQGRNQKIDRGRLVELFPTGTATGTGGPFQETVDKSAELLRERPDSKWADDALLLIGKAYFYQRNFVGAEQKFRETAEAAVVRDQPRLADEARLWLGRTYAATERYDEGVAVLQDALAQTEIDPRWRAQIQLALGELYGRAERWQDAAAAIRAGIETVGDRELAARAYLLLGQVEEASDHWDAAAEAYAAAAQRAPAYELEYAARLNEALVLGLDAGRTEEAVDKLRALRRDDKNFQQRAEVELAWARVQAAGGDAPGALRRFRDVLYDEELAGGAVRGEAHFRLAEFYRDVERDFVRASAHFDTAATALPATPDASVRLSRAAIRDPRRDAETFTSIAATSRRIAEIDSLVGLAALSEEDFAARIQEIEAERRRVFLEEQRQTNQLRANEAFRDDQLDVAPSSARAAGDAALRRTAAGFLAHRDPASVQAGQIAFEQAWGARPLVPDWRRRAAVEATAIETAAGSGGADNQARLPSGLGPTPLDLTVIPRTPEQEALLAVELAELRYELANALFLSLARADSAVVLYRRILDETPDAPVASRARYALAEIEYAAGRVDAAAPLFEAVIDADPDSDLARAARIRLGIDPAEAPEERPEISDRSAERFAAARQRWTGGDPLGAMVDFVALGEADPDAAVAPRAFLAGAAAYADFARGDSLLLTAALPDSLAPALFRDSTELTPDELAPEEQTADELAPGELAPDAAASDAPAADERLPGADAPDELATELNDRGRQLERPVREAAVDDEELQPDEELRPREDVLPPKDGDDLEIDEDELRPRDRRRPQRVEEALDEDPVVDDEDPVVDDEELRPRQTPRPVGAPAPVDEGSERAVDTLAAPAPDALAPDTPTADTLTADAPVADLAPTDADALLDGEDRQLERATDAPRAVPNALADTLGADTLGADTLGADTLGADTLGVVDALQVPARPAFTLRDYLEALAERYPGTVEATRAQALLAALPQEALPDVASAVPNALPADSVEADPDALETVTAETVTPEPGVLEPSAGDERAAAPPVDLDATPYGTFGEAPLNPAAGGYSRRTNALADAAEASELVRQLVEEGYRAAVATDGEDVFVVVGQYPSDKALAIATAELPAATLGAGTGIVELADIELLPLAEEEDGR